MGGLIAPAQGQQATGLHGPIYSPSGAVLYDPATDGALTNASKLSAYPLVIGTDVPHDTAAGVGAIATSEAGADNGVATLDGTGNVPAAQLGNQAVKSVFGRTGAVVAASGDYTAAEVGAIPASAEGAANGVATLDSSGNVPATELGNQAVKSVFGRTGAVVAATGDYDFAEIGGTAANGQLAGPLLSGITAGSGIAVTGGPSSGTGSPTVAASAVPNSALSGPLLSSVAAGSGITVSGAPGSGTGAQTIANAGVTSFNGRTGAVSPATGDYGFSQIAGTLAASQLPFTIQYGATAVGSSTSGTVTFPTAFSSTPVILVSVTEHNATIEVWVYTTSSTSFEWEASNNGFTLNWLAIGS